ncbi:MAG: acyl carrier protein [Patescibacteria group bacterium]|nr:acyl carrier protein [Patescibacteria group bacterium]MDD5554071.1 acyl carrier protein [Patescibacteria group bacterium]
MPETVEARVKKVITNKFRVDKEKVTPELSIIDNLGADSLDTVELIMDLEIEFKIEISDADAEKLRTIQDIISYIEKRLREQTE